MNTQALNDLLLSGVYFTDDPLVQACATAPTGHFIRCDVYGNVIAVTHYLTHGLGLVYRKNADGTVSRVHF